MENTILKNDAFRVLLEITGMTSTELEKRIVDVMEENELICGEWDELGESIWDIFKENNFDATQMVSILFPNIETSEQLSEVLDSIHIWGTGTEHPCCECGSEMTAERDGCDGKYWNEWTCENPCCENKDSDEPDWDTMQGGHDCDD